MLAYILKIKMIKIVVCYTFSVKRALLKAANTSNIMTTENTYNIIVAGSVTTVADECVADSIWLFQCFHVRYLYEFAKAHNAYYVLCKHIQIESFGTVNWPIQ